MAAVARLENEVQRLDSKCKAQTMSIQELKTQASARLEEAEERRLFSPVRRRLIARAISNPTATIQLRSVGKCYCYWKPTVHSPNQHLFDRFRI